MSSEATEPSNPERKSLPLMRWLTAVFVALAVYVLSTAPVFRLAEAGRIPKATVMIYRPLASLYEFSPAFARFIDWYVKLWPSP